MSSGSDPEVGYSAAMRGWIVLVGLVTACASGSSTDSPDPAGTSGAAGQSAGTGGSASGAGGSAAGSGGSVAGSAASGKGGEQAAGSAGAAAGAGGAGAAGLAGGGGEGGGGEGGAAGACVLAKPYSSKDKDCNACAEEKCCAQVNACLTDKRCDEDFVNCTLACALLPDDTDPEAIKACLADCDKQFPEGKKLYDDAIGCADKACAVECQ